MLLDYSVILGWMAVLALATLLLWLLTGKVHNWLELGVTGAQALGFLVLVAPVGIYLYATESFSAQATWGKAKLGLKVVDAATGGKPSKAQVLLRTAIKLLPWEIAHFAVWHIVARVSSGQPAFNRRLMAVTLLADALPFAYVASVAFQRDRRGPHDLAAGTQVVDARVN
ncbi:hypothetical protein AUR04nite_23960 [Glutamicibacter uratoxydans]|uniref:RDD domain-containing protein n=2 Tax=Glutamicibacter uratoxydans TaxID=43667 RepID=A0A4Y4DSI7_GLUUR|nr:hypothetical protein AUR04nite_23960 [Glutamicibacter uratoxydans]